MVVHGVEEELMSDLQTLRSQLKVVFSTDSDSDEIVHRLVANTSSIESEPEALSAETHARPEAAPHFEGTAAISIGNLVERHAPGEGGEEFDAFDKVGLARSVPAEQNGQGVEQVEFGAGEVLEVGQAVREESRMRGFYLRPVVALRRSGIVSGAEAGQTK
ncbi:MAG: hypothetical protein OXH52_04045 [Gammaproteobacteria bacterium]|nr:hypothetical protein [Gammaproteobacteria bacterium]